MKRHCERSGNTVDRQDRNIKKMMRTYSDLIKLPTFEERFRYLKIYGRVGEDTFGFSRYLNQIFYKSDEWRRIRDAVILRDNGCDLAMRDWEIRGRVYVHHMNPITEQDILEHSAFLFDPEFLITASHITHNAIHYGDESLLPTGWTERTRNDTCPWKCM